MEDQRTNQAMELKKLMPEPLRNGRDSNIEELPELTEEETLKVIHQARIIKKAKLYEIEYNIKLNEQAAIWEPNAADFKAYILNKNQWFKVDEQSQKIFEILLLYFTNDPEFEKLGYNLNKGILLAGGVGCGKTVLLELFFSNPKASYGKVDSAKISEEFAKHGFEVIEMYSKKRPGRKNMFGQSEFGLFIDDIGTDEDRKNYGNTTNAVADILSRRYNVGIPYYMTHGTTNLNGEEMLDMYGDRLMSRIRGMFNIISFAPGSVDRRLG